MKMHACVNMQTASILSYWYDLWDWNAIRGLGVRIKNFPKSKWQKFDWKVVLTCKTLGLGQVYWYFFSAKNKISFSVELKSES